VVTIRIQHEMGAAIRRPVLIVGLLFSLTVIALAGSARAQSGSVSEQAWRRWLLDLAPLMLGQEPSVAKTVPAEDRSAFIEAFWARRDPDPSTTDNEVKTELEARIRSADKRFRAGGTGAWNPCGLTFLLLGTPDWTRNRTAAAHYGSSDPLLTMRTQDDQVSDIWVYRNHPRLPPSPLGFTFRFTPECEALGGQTALRLLSSVPATYLRPQR
jgi:GWxTD domain-containing protein